MAYRQTKKPSEDLATLFAQFSSAEFLTSLLSCLSDENTSGLSDSLQDIAHIQPFNLNSVNVSPSLKVFNVNVAPASVLPNGLSLMKLLAQQGSVDEILLQKYQDLWNSCDISTAICDDADSKISYRESMTLLLENWDYIASYVAQRVEPSIPSDHCATALNDFADYHDANLNSTQSASASHGRFYLDVWEENQYLSKLGPSTKLRPLADWSELFHHYDQVVDGSYREWLVASLDERKERYLKCPKKKRKIDPIFVPYDLTLSAEHKEGMMKIVPPPVLVSCVHPAAWTVKRSAANSATHPASWVPSSSGSSNSNGSVASRSRQQQSIQNCNAVGIASSGGGSSGSVSGSMHRVSSQNALDDFTLAHDKLSSELKALELANMVRLCRVQRFADFRKNLELLVERKHRVEEVMCHAMTSDSVRANLRAMNAVRPVTSVLSNVDHASNHTNGSGHRRVKQECFWYVSTSNEASEGNVIIGNSSSHNSKSSGLQEIHTGQEVDVFLGEEWVVCKILRLRKDKNFIRQVKVLPEGGGPTSAMWISVEDELLAPLGKHTTKQ